MEQLARVRRRNDDGTAQVVVLRESACSGDCHKCSGCGAQQQSVTFTAINAIGAKPGELVKVEAKSGPVLAAAAMLYMMPILLFFLGYGLGAALWQQGALAGGIAFLLGIVLAAGYDRAVASKQNAVYTITGYPAPGRLISQIKGDNDLD